MPGRLSTSEGIVLQSDLRKDERYYNNNDSMYESFIIQNNVLVAMSTMFVSLDSRPRRERRPGILCMRMREIIDNNFIIQIVKKRAKLQKGRIHNDK